MRPAYKNPIGDLFSQPKAVWKGTTNRAKQMANSTTDLGQSQASLYHSLQSPQTQHNQLPYKQPYLSPPLPGHITEEVMFVMAADEFNCFKLKLSKLWSVCHFSIRYLRIMH